MTMVKTPSIIALVMSTAPGTSAPWRSPVPWSWGTTPEREHGGGDSDRQVHEENPVPVDGLGQNSAGQQPDRAAR